MANTNTNTPTRKNINGLHKSHVFAGEKNHNYTDVLTNLWLDDLIVVAFGICTNLICVYDYL